MSDDPETARQIAELATDTRPLLVLDVDEVVLEFVRPFIAFLRDRGLDMRTDSFRLHGNVFDPRTGSPAENDHVTELLQLFFEMQEEWQVAAVDCVDTLATLAERLEIVMLTAMPHRHRATRRRILDRLGLPYPLVTTESAKGPAIARLRGSSPRPVAFVDDIPVNLVSVRKSVPDARLFHLMAHAGLRALLPPLPDGVHAVKDWHEAGIAIAAALGV